MSKKKTKKSADGAPKGDISVKIIKEAGFDNPLFRGLDPASALKKSPSKEGKQ